MKANKTIIITGGSRGIGAATSLLAAEQGYAVCVNYRNNANAAMHIVEKIISKGGKALAIKADISIETDVMKMFDQVDAEFGVLNALVNNAGVLELQKCVVDIDAPRLYRVLGVNFIGSFLCAREAVRRMAVSRGGKGGSIVNVSSAAARLGSPGEYVDYAASKGAVDTLTIGLSHEVAADGIRVNGVRPGYIYTEIHASGGEPGRVDRIKNSLPMKRGGNPEEVAKAIVWLL